MPPLREQPGNGPVGTPEGQLSVTEFVAELGALISELESAKGGSQSLDIRIHHGFRISGGHGEDIASLMIREGISWPTVQATLNEIVPPYSTSLDAALQGEEIVFAIRSAKGHRWGAMQRTSSGGEALAWAATEPLARRLAALKYWHAELMKSLDDQEIDAGQTPTHRPETRKADILGADGPIAPNDEAGPRGRESATGSPKGDVTPLHDDPERTPPENPGQSDQPDQIEKDWKILF